MLRPTFVLLDGSRVLFRSGPTGGSLSDVKAGQTIVASTDSLAADAYGWDHLLERRSESLPAYFAKAAARKLGDPDWKAHPVKEVQVG
jgi:uridine phosphorylase